MPDDFKELIEEAEKLIGLLKDAPVASGCHTWHLAVQRCREKIWNYESPEKRVANHGR